MPHTRILIVGAGVAGLATARALARGGFSAEVIERQSGWREAGTGIYLPANATRAMRALGLEQAVLERGAVISRSTIEEVALDAWVRGRVVLVGDAAHATSPNMAEGAAMALEDALVLAACLRRHDAMPAALSDFEARRHPRTDWVRDQTHRRDRTRHLPPVVRNAVLRAFGRRIFRSNYRPLRQEVM